MAFFPISEVVDALAQLQQLLDVTDRSIAVGVINNTDYTLNLTQSDGTSNFSSGGYQAGNLPRPSIPPRPRMSSARPTPPRLQESLESSTTPPRIVMAMMQAC